MNNFLGALHQCGSRRHLAWPIMDNTGMHPLTDGESQLEAPTSPMLVAPSAPMDDQAKASAWLGRSASSHEGQGGRPRQPEPPKSLRLEAVRQIMARLRPPRLAVLTAANAIRGDAKFQDRGRGQDRACGRRSERPRGLWPNSSSS